MSELLTTRQVADRLSVHQTTVARWARDQQIPSVRIGPVVRIRSEDLEDWIEAHYQPAIPNPYYRPYPQR